MSKLSYCIDLVQKNTNHLRVRAQMVKKRKVLPDVQNVRKYLSYFGLLG